MKKEKAEKSMRDLFYDNADLVSQSFRTMQDAVVAYCQNKMEIAHEKAKETIAIEKTQDRSRDEIVKRIFSKETMVFSRPDRLKLVESMDSLCDETEIVVRKLLQHNPIAPVEISSGLEDMANNIGKIGSKLQGLIKAVLEDFSKGDEFINQITDIRRDVRDCHWALLEKNYALKPEIYDFIYFKDMIKAIAKVADKAEEFSDGIHGLLCKYAL
ncbi:hypothetical protein NEF87_004933 [Candidatus Lokiarchaeum ossiferum]|uniref:DUF47 family protein n=1 Tax=Candidatus Lokiarchaeum ossiferum TaxID=2951803 RepID=A0ABY6HZ17_9ARCH|nr:hypothetical protein NEF87_004933 [Candidatus Lokiarchaeum sp. B-35]